MEVACAQRLRAPRFAGCERSSAETVLEEGGTGRCGGVARNAVLPLSAWPIDRSSLKVCLVCEQGRAAGGHTGVSASAVRYVANEACSRSSSAKLRVGSVSARCQSQVHMWMGVCVCVCVRECERVCECV